MKKTILLLLAIFCLSNNAFTQSDKARIKKAKQAEEAKDYSTALAHYDIVITGDEGKDKEKAKRSSLENYYSAAENARRTKVYYRAEEYYSRVTEFENGTSVHPQTKFWLADVQLRQGKYQQAIDNFQAYLDGGGSANAAFADKARKYMLDCAYAMELEPAFSSDRVAHLKDSVNSDVSDFAPIKSGELLYFSSLRENYEMMSIVDEKGSPWIQQVDDWRAKQDAAYGLTHIYTKKDGDKDVDLFDQFNEVDKHTAHIAFANDNKRIYYTLCERVNASKIDCQIYYRDQTENGKWGAKVALPENINKPGYTTTQPSIGLDKQANKDLLFFTSDRPGTYGGLDIWCSFVNDDGTFSDPVNLNESFGENGLNTAEDEVSPFWDASTQTLYFSSEGHLGIGSHDVYKVKKKIGKWQEIEHMGTPVNSSYDDMYYSISQDRKSAYMTSNRPGGKCSKSSSDSLCICNDIYMIEMPKVRLEVYTFNAIDSSAIDVNTVQLTNLDNEENDAQEDGRFFEWFDAPLDFNFDYGLVGLKPKYSNGTSSFTTKVDESEQDDLVIIDSLYLMPEMDLTTYVYDISTGVDVPLKGATVQVYLIDSQPRVIANHKDADKSNYFNMLTHDHTYMVTGHKAEDSFLPDTTYITIAGAKLSTMGVTTPFSLKAELRLCKGLNPLPNVSVYFDNDIPHGTLEGGYGDGTAIDTVSLQQYDFTYYNYLKAKPSFVNKFAAGSSSRVEMENFFRNDVEGGFANLNRFAQQLYDYFRTEADPTKKVVLEMRGYASLRSNPDYNLHLSKRRVSSLIQFFENWRGENEEDRLTDYVNRLDVNFQFKGDTEPCMGRGPCYEKSAIEDVNASRDRRVDIVGARTVNNCKPGYSAPGKSDN